jgi:hypothetical protein
MNLDNELEIITVIYEYINKTSVRFMQENVISS